MKTINLTASNINELKTKMDNFKKDHKIVSAYYTFNTVEYYHNQTPYAQVKLLYY